MELHIVSYVNFGVYLPKLTLRFAAVSSQANVE